MQHDKSSGVPLAKLYEEDHELAMLPNRAEFEGGGVGVEAGIAQLLDMMETGRFKVSDTFTTWWDEFRTYHRKDGRLVKQRDDLMAATRYAVMMLRHAETKREATKRWEPLKYSNMGIV